MKGTSPSRAIRLAKTGGVCHDGKHLSELHVHLRQCILHPPHMSHMPALAKQQYTALTPQRARHADLLGGRNAPLSKPWIFHSPEQQLCTWRR